MIPAIILDKIYWYHLQYLRRKLCSEYHTKYYKYSDYDYAYPMMLFNPKSRHRVVYHKKTSAYVVLFRYPGERTFYLRIDASTPYNQESAKEISRDDYYNPQYPYNQDCTNHLGQMNLTLSFP